MLFCFIHTPTVEDIKDKIVEFEKKFNTLKRSTREGLERRSIIAKKVVVCLTDLRADDMPDHKVFLQSNIQILFKASDLYELFGTLNFHWDYLAYHLLDHLIREFFLEEVKGEMDNYMRDMKKFRKVAPLKLFCQAQTRRRIKPPAEFREVVAEFNWPDDITLEVVEQFRQEYASHYRLRECAMMLTSIREGSFIVTWFIPESIVELLLTFPAEKLMVNYNVRKLDIAGNRVYFQEEEQQVSVVCIIQCVVCSIQSNVLF